MLKSERLEIRISTKDKEDLNFLAKEQGLSMSNMLIFLLKQELNKNNGGEN